MCRLELKQGLNKVERVMAEGQCTGRGPELGVDLLRSGFGLGQTEEGREKKAIGMRGWVVTRRIL